MEQMGMKNVLLLFCSDFLRLIDLYKNIYLHVWLNWLLVTQKETMRVKINCWDKYLFIGIGCNGFYASVWSKATDKSRTETSFPNYLLCVFALNAHSICSHFTMECVTKKGFSFFFFSFLLWFYCGILQKMLSCVDAT